MDFNVYLIGDKNLFKTERDYLSALELAFEGGIKAFQLRQKDVSIREFIKLGEKVKKITDKFDGIRLFVNDRVDAALALGAYGVHLNAGSIPVKAVKKRIKNLKIFYSSHSLEEALKAQEDGADAVTFSPVFRTKGMDFQQGTSALKKVVKSLKIPVFALGGINAGNIEEIKRSGVTRIALQKGVLGEKDIKAAAEVFIKACRTRR